VTFKVGTEVLPMMQEIDYRLRPIGVVRSVLKERSGAPRQGYERAPDVWIEVIPEVVEGLEGLAADMEIVVVTWLHQGRRDVLKVHPRGNKNVLAGVFATRSPDRPNPIGLHRVTVLEISGRKLKVGPLEAIDGTPVVDIKPVVSRSADC
jgi:tRNA-Thr(GGU) m(6)t(6)A37 methyltransferase TsaA